MKIDPEISEWYARTRRKQGLPLGLSPEVARGVADQLARSANSQR